MSPQYWQVNLSLRNTLNLVKFGCLNGFIKLFKAITLGKLISKDGLRTFLPYVDTILTLFKKTDLIRLARYDRKAASESRSNLVSLFNNKTFDNRTIYVIENENHLRNLKFLYKNNNVGFFFINGTWIMVPDQKNKMTKDVVAGLGEIGSPIYKLLSKNQDVVGYDKEQEAVDILNDRFAKHINKQLSVVLSDMENFPTTKTTLVNASYSLPFCNPQNFKNLWNNIDKSLPVDGVFCGQLFGINDSWSINQDMTFHTSDQIENIFNKYVFVREKLYSTKSGVKEY